MRRRSIIHLSVLVLYASLMAVGPAEAAATCMGRRATIVGSARSETLTGTRRADVIVGRGGRDTIKGRGGADFICAGSGGDSVSGGGGNDRVRGEGGDDSLKGNDGPDRLEGGVGTDTCLGGAGTTTYLTCEKPTFSLSITKAGAGQGAVTSAPTGIACPADCSQSYAVGKIVTLTAAAEASSSFQGWSGACAGTGACSVSMDRARSVTATFVMNQYSLSVNKSGSGTVTGIGINCGLDCVQTFDHGTVVQLTSAPEAGWEAAGFTGCDSSDSDSCTVTMTSDRTVEAAFEETSPCADYDPEWWPIGIWLSGSGPNGEQYVCFSTGEPEELAEDRGWIATGLSADICVEGYEGTGMPENMDEGGLPRGAHGGDLICLDGETPPVESFEFCNGLDDDYDVLIDETFPKLGETTPSEGTWQCSSDGRTYVDSGT